MFLHWYHHILTLIYGFYSYPVSPAYNRWGIYLNFAVHSFMYRSDSYFYLSLLINNLFSYYFLRSIRVPIPGAVAKAITTGQILQVFHPFPLSIPSLSLQFVLSIVVLVFCGVEYYILKVFIYRIPPPPLP